VLYGYPGEIVTVRTSDSITKAKLRQLLKAQRILRHALSSEKYISSNALRVALCLLAALLMACQHLIYSSPSAGHDAQRYRIYHASGLRKGVYNYTYGLYYWGLFPVYSTYELNLGGPDKYNKDFARNLLVERGETLRMEYEHEIRFGEYFKFYLPYLASLVAGRPVKQEIGTINTFFFLFALFLILLEFYRCGRPVTGVFVSLLVSSSEFQALQLRDNSFSYVITAAAFTIAMMAPFIFGRRMNPLWIAVRLAVASFFIIFCGNVRSTALSMVLGPPIVLLFYRRQQLRWKAVLLLSYFAIFAAVQKGVQAYFDYKIGQARNFVEAVGGVPYYGESLTTHPFWHPIWCGLADFDTKYKREWEDGEAFSKAVPELKKRGWESPRGDLTHGDKYLLSTSPEYERVMRDFVIADIRNDPMWYLDIIAKRIKKTLTEWQEPRLDLFFCRLPLPYSFWPYLVGAIVLLVLGMWSEIKLLMLTVPTATLAIVITTYTNGHYYFIAHLVCAGTVLACAANGIASSAARLVLRRREAVPFSGNDTGAPLVDRDGSSDLSIAPPVRNAADHASHSGPIDHADGQEFFAKSEDEK